MSAVLTDEIHFALDANQCSIVEAWLQKLSDLICVMGARGAGKSAVIRAIVIMTSIAAKRQILYASQSSSNSLDQFNKITQDPNAQGFFYAGHDREPFTTKPHPTIRWANGSETIFWSMENDDHKRGMHPHVVIIDEAQSISQYAYDSVLFPMRIRFGKFARMIVAGSCPETDGHWWWKLHEDGKTPGNERGAMSFSLTVENSLPFRSPAGKLLVAQAKANSSQKAFECEYLLKPGGRGDTYFKHEDIEEACREYKKLQTDPSKIDHPRGTILVYDPALGRQDPAAYLIMDLAGNVLLSHSIDKKKRDTEQVQELVDKAKEWKSLVVIESNSTPWMTYAGALKSLLPHGVRDVPLRAISSKSGEGKSILCKQLAWMLEHRQMRINPECKELIKQLKSIRDYKTPSGNLDIRAPEGEHDDEAFCCVIAAEALRKGWSPEFGDGRNAAMSLL